MKILLNLTETMSLQTMKKPLLYLKGTMESQVPKIMNMKEGRKVVAQTSQFNTKQELPSVNKPSLVTAQTRINSSSS